MNDSNIQKFGKQSPSEQAIEITKKIIEDAWEQLTSANPFCALPSQVYTDIEMAHNHFTNIMSELQPSQIIPLIVLNYMLKDITILGLEQSPNTNQVSLLRQLENRTPEEGVAFVGQPNDLPKNAVFGELWKDQDINLPEDAAASLSVRSYGDLTQMLTALYAVKYLDAYLWDIRTVPNILPVFKQAVEGLTGLNPQAFSEVTERWNKLLS